MKIINADQTCPNCGHYILVREWQVGKVISCPKCHKEYFVTNVGNLEYNYIQIMLQSMG